MKVSEEELLRAGFSRADLQKIKNNVASHGGTLGGAIHDLANRFRVVLWVSYGCLAVFIWVMFSSNPIYVASTAIGLLITILITLFVQPPVLSYKSWRYWKINRKASQRSDQ
ncbi:TPA: hypothetical protein PPN70_004176 [Serratia rubidaea]|uniref:hypothetical protein n=1 Tax=Serratia rubidaea TaxID=61652 RepID=UPI0023B09313|nr:hypothetical protein [Serratia rubidaea]MDK1703520.1 hypothetical protein [Serratia rubidaea]HDJ1441723.1 hypothetical protein [Serratia rubidaea]HDJ1447336.1 hypothetical protein [Serratia rubidaea]HDJ1460565.1 hypothetical protein [Serratia rubidaea]HDJ2772071.1 hypothetical protein [Serratia rubidaea]